MRVDQNLLSWGEEGESPISKLKPTFVCSKDQCFSIYNMYPNILENLVKVHILIQHFWQGAQDATFLTNFQRMSGCLSTDHTLTRGFTWSLLEVGYNFICLCLESDLYYLSFVKTYLLALVSVLCK